VTGPAPAGRPDTVLRVLGLVMSLAFVVVVGRVVQLQLAPGAELLPHLSDRQATFVQMVPRGDVIDRRGRVLATTRSGYRLFVDPTLLVAPYGQLMSDIARVTGVDEGEVAERVIGKLAENERRLTQNRAPIRYISVGGILNDAQLEDARRLDSPAIALERRPVREVPGGNDIAAILGKVGVDDDGLMGAELAFDDELEPQPGHLTYTRDSRGRPLWIESAGYEPGSTVAPVRLTIDLELQRIAREELERGVKDSDAAGGRLVLVDPVTGDILAMVDHVRDLPGLAEPPARVVLKGRVVEPDSTGIRYRTIRPDDGRATHPALARNRCVEDLYEPGSTFKSFIWASIVERGLARVDEWFDTHNGTWVTDYGRVIRDVSPKPSLTWSQVLIHSSNIGMVQGIQRMSFSQTRRDVLRFGFGRKVGLGLPGESGGIITSLKDWSKYTQTSVASGYEVAVTPVQMVRAFSVFARNDDLAGTLPELRLRVDPSDDPLTAVRYQVVPPWVAYTTRDTLQHVGNAMEQRARLRFPDEPPLLHGLFGKSGTAEIPRHDGKGYYRGQYNSSFLAAAPLAQPKLVIVVVIDDPGPEQIRTRQHYGTAVAGPVVRRVLRRSLEYLGVPAMGDPVAPLMAEFESQADAEAHAE